MLGGAEHLGALTWTVPTHRVAGVANVLPDVEGGLRHRLFDLADLLDPVRRDPERASRSCESQGAFFSRLTIESSRPARQPRGSYAQ
jgi:hypothetical protein